MKWEHKRFKSYGEFIEFLNSMPPGWSMHSWQDVTRQHGFADVVAVRALFIVTPEER